MKTKFLTFLTLNLVLVFSAHAQFTANFQTNTISAVTSNWVGNGTYVVGSNTFEDVLQISNGGVLSNGPGYVGYETSGSNNSAIVSGTGSVWSNAPPRGLFVGNSGAGNSLIISNGGGVFDRTGSTLGENSSSSNNTVLVSGAGSVWGASSLHVGNSGAANSLIISNGGAVSSGGGTLGANSSSSNNTVLVSGAGSVWTNNGALTIGGSGAANSLIVSNGGLMGGITVNGVLMGLNPSSSSNTVAVTGPGSVWRIDSLAVGYSSVGNSLTIADGGLVTSPGGVVLGSSSFSSSNTVTVTGPGSVWIPSGVGPSIGLIIGYSGAGNTLTITNGGLMSVVGAPTVLGQNTSSSSNAVLVSGQGSVWSNFFNLVVGSSGTGNSITISNGGVLYDGLGYGPSVLGSNAVSSGNTVTVTGSGSVWSNEPDLYVGDFGPGNTLTIANGGAVFSTNGYLGYNLGSSNNTALVSGPGSVWSNTGSLIVGGGAANSLIISNGGAVYDGTAVLGYFSSLIFSSNNTAIVAGIGSVWSNQSSLIVGYGSDSNLLEVTGGSVLASNIVIGGGVNNVLRLDSGSVIVKNALGNGSLVVGGQGQGALQINGGSLTTDSLIVTNNTGGSFIYTNVVNFNGGVINSGGAAVTNGLVFLVGDGVDAAIYHVLGGVHSFADGLEVSSNAVLSGCGTISGTVVVDPGGMVLADCGGTLTFTGILTNNGILRAVNGSVLEAYGPVVNNGIIDIQTGTTNFHSTFINNGTVADASYFRVTSITRQSNDIQLRWATIGGRSYVVQTNTPTVNGSYTNAFTDVGVALLAPGLNVGTTNYIDVGGATNSPSRYYRIRLMP